MSLQFIAGGSGSGKTWYGCREIIKESLARPQERFYCIVPEQFTMQTQKTLVEMHPGKGILNIDVLSFQRLSYRILEETGGDMRRILEDTGKSMVLRRVIQEQEGKLPYLGSQMKKPGCIDEIKSLISEFMQYGIHETELEEFCDQTRPDTLLQKKLRDIVTVYAAFRSFLADTHVTAEEMLEAVLPMLPRSEKLAGSTFLFDGFTGFTPLQLNFLQGLLKVAARVRVTVTIDTGVALHTSAVSHRLFGMSQEFVRRVSELTRDQEPPVFMDQHSRHTRFAKAPALAFLEQNLFRYRTVPYHENEGERLSDQLILHASDTPASEMIWIARRIRSLVREKHIRYGEIAVITGNLEEYGSLAAQAFEKARIPCFIDEKYSILMNPFVEYLRAALEMVDTDFSYESVFRFLRTGLFDLDREKTDRLENYVLAMGIRGRHRWMQEWVRPCRGMPAEELAALNEWRSLFSDRVGPLAENFAGGPRTVREYCVILYRFVEASRIQIKLKRQEQAFSRNGDKAREKEYAQIYGIVMDILEKMVDVLGNEAVSRREYRQILETGLAQQKIGLIPVSLDEVLVGDMERTRLKDIKILFFAGMNEGNVPKNVQSGGFLTESDRDLFADRGIILAPDPRERIRIGRFYLYLNMTKPSRMLCLSYAGTSGSGEALRPAYLVEMVRGLFPGLTTDMQSGREREAIPEMEWEGLELITDRIRKGEDVLSWDVSSAVYTWLLSHKEYRQTLLRLVEAAYRVRHEAPLAKTVARALYGEISPYGATRLERYCACACAHFMQYGLKLFPRDRFEFRAVDMGNLMHDALSRFSAGLIQDHVSWKELSEADRNRRIDDALAYVSRNYGGGILSDSSRSKSLILRAGRILRRTVWVLQDQLSRGEFEPESFELPVEGGRIDRIDICPSRDRILVKVIDYKTGSTAFDLGRVYYGLQLQLILYADAALSVWKMRRSGAEILPAGVFYFSIKDPVVEAPADMDAQDITAAFLKQQKLSGLAVSDPEILRRMDSSLASLPVSVKKDGTFSKTSSVASAGQFAALERHVKKKIQDCMEKILDGDVRTVPNRLDDEGPCRWCAYSDACGFDRRTPGYGVRQLQKLSADEIWRRLAGPSGAPAPALQKADSEQEVIG